MTRPLLRKRITGAATAFFFMILWLPGAASVVRRNGRATMTASAAAFQSGASPATSRTAASAAGAAASSIFNVGDGRRMRCSTSTSSIASCALRSGGNGNDEGGDNSRPIVNDDVIPSSTLPSFYERLGRPRTVVAPMVAQSDLAFRMLTRRHGADLAYTQMIHATNFVKDETFRVNHLDVYPPGLPLAGDERGSMRERYVESQVNCLEGCPEAETEAEAAAAATLATPASFPGEGGPVIVQLAGHEPEIVSSAALHVLDRATSAGAGGEGGGTGGGNPDLVGFDLNLGCPQSIARKGRYGAFLMEESVDLVCSVLSKLRNDLPSDIGVTAKVRLPNLPESSPPDLAEKELVERVHKLIDAGVGLITVHGRTLRENKTRVRGCNWDAIRLVAETARSYSGDTSYPVIANGGIEYPSDVTRCLQHTCASAVMSSEALLENPGLFSPYAKDDANLTPRQIFDRQVGYATEYLDLVALYPPLPGSLGKVGGSFNVVRSHLFKMLYRYFEEDPSLRDALAHKDTTSIHHARMILDDLKGRYANLDDDEWERLPSSRRSGEGGGSSSSWYRRYRDASARVHTRGDAALKEQRRRAGGASDTTMSVDEKKRIMRERIRKLKEEREQRGKKNNAPEEKKSPTVPEARRGAEVAA